MIVYKSSAFKVSGIEFCCNRMAKELLIGAISTSRWADDDLEFRIENQRLAYCPYCGTRIENKLRLKNDK